MTDRLVLVLVLIPVLLAAGCTPRDAPRDAPPAGLHDPVVVLVYNIHAGKDAGGVDNLDRVAAIVRSSDADLVLLQEVDRETRRSGGIDQIAALERLTGFHGAFGRTLDYQGGEYGIAILSRWPIASDTVIRIPVDPPQERAGGVYEPRGVLRAVVSGSGSGIGVLNTHIDPSPDDHYRLQEIATVIQAAGALRAVHPFTLVGGDMNAEPGSAVIARMTDAGWVDAWSVCGAGDGGTYPADAPVKRIDYLFLPGGVTCDRAEVLSTTASDHRPLLVTVRPGLPASSERLEDREPGGESAEDGE